MTVIETINTNYPRLSRTQRRIADFILSSSDRACFLSLKELSSQTSTSEVTIIRFTRDMGYENFSDLKRELQQYIRTRLSPSEKIASGIDSLKETQDSIAQIIAQDRDNMERTLARLNAGDLKRTVSLIKQGRRIYTVGDNISEIVTRFINLRLKNLGLDAAEFDLSSYDAMASQLLRVVPGDVFIIVSFPNYARRIIPLTEFLHNSGNLVICITDRVASPIAAHASVVFPCATDSSVFYNSLTAPVAVANTILSGLAVELNEGFKEYRRKIGETVQFLREAEKDPAD